MRIRKWLALAAALCIWGTACADGRNAITLLEQQDRGIECRENRDEKPRKGISLVTGLKSAEPFQPVLVELNNENGGVFATAPYGISKASVIYEYQMSTNGTMGLCALFQDEAPENVGPVGNASVGGLLIQSDWDCGYVFNDIPHNPDGSESELGYSIRMWMEQRSLEQNRRVFPAEVSSVKEWKHLFRRDQSMITSENRRVDVSGIREILQRNGNTPKAVPFRFSDQAEDDSGIPVSEVDIRTSSRTFSSGFVYDAAAGVYPRWIGENNQYGDIGADEQLTVSNLIIQRVGYTVSGGNMAPEVIGRGNADIFIRGTYIEGYWIRESEEDHTRFYDQDGEPLELAPGATFIALLSNSTTVVILND